MIGPIPTGSLASAEISATISDTLRVTLADGRPGKLAIVDELDVVVDSSQRVADEAFLVAIACYKNFLIGQGHIERIDTSCQSAPIDNSQKATLGRKAVHGLIRAIAGSAKLRTAHDSQKISTLSSSEI